VSLSAQRFRVFPWNDDATSGVNSAFTYTHAFDIGASANTTINGVVFNGTGTGGNPSLAGSYSTTGLPNLFQGDVNNLLTGSSELLTRDFLYNGTTGGNITLQGLTPGQTYTFQLFGTGWEGDTAATTDSRAISFLIDGNRYTLNADVYGLNNGFRMEYTYTATSSTEVIAFDPLNNTNTLHAYAFGNYAVPEPGSAVLLLAGVALTLARQRGRRRA
jgi:hypothetical protein